MRRPMKNFITCTATGKRRWDTKQDAKHHRELLSDRTLRPYRCEHCSGWHVGHHGGHDRQWHRDHHAGEEHSGLVEIATVVRMLRPDKPGKMRAVLERMAREGLVEAESALGITLIAAHEIPRLKRIAHDRSQDLRLKGM